MTRARPPAYASTTALVRLIGLDRRRGRKVGLATARRRFYDLCAEVGWAKIHLTAPQAARLGADVSAHPREWYYPTDRALALWREYLGRGRR